jgi:phospholipid-binding lipoprotein MlaA
MQTRIRVSCLSLSLLCLFGCAAKPAKPDPRDPWERMNRSTYQFNDKVDRAIFRPIAHTYVRITPQFMQTGVSNFFDNIRYPVVMVNDLLQGEFKGFAKDTGRLVMNTTLGLGGLFDPATSAGLEKNDRDFGQTFGKWGIPSGPYVVLPFLGPSDVRDGLGLIPTYFYADPRAYINDDAARWSLWGVGVLDTRARLISTEPLLDSAYDPYAFLRNAYLQRRQFMISGGQPSNEEEQQQEKLYEEATEATDEQQPQAPKQPPQQPQGQQPQGEQPPPPQSPPKG